jgi:hypothetical protein
MFRSEWRIIEASAVLFLASACSSHDAASRMSAAGQTPGCALVSAKPATRDSASLTEDVRAGRRYRCTLHAGGPTIGVVLIADSAENTISRIELRHESDTVPFQTLTEGETESPYRGADFFTTRDLDNDGFSDLLLLSEWGATGNAFYHVWRWNPSAQRFVFDSTLSAMSRPTPLRGRACVSTRANGGRAGMIYDADTLCLEQGRWIRVAAESQQYDDRLKAFVRVVRTRRGDSLVLTRVDTVRDSTR